MEKLEAINKNLQEFIFKSKYARWDEKLGRRENWEEAIDRVCNMHLTKYSQLSDEDKEQIKWAFSLVKDKRVVPSARSLQFGGEAILVNNSRLFNCCARYIDSVRAFAEMAFLALCGVGTGIGLYKKYVDKLPPLVSAEDKTGTIINYTIEDTIEGWADSLEALLSCYFRNNSLSGRKIAFDYSKIRRKGAKLKTSGGTAPGYKPLKIAHQKIKKLLDTIIEDEGVTKLRPIHAYDILMYFFDAVLSGGIRRTASSTLFDKDDEEMMNSKTVFDVKKFRSSLDTDTNTQHCRIWVGKQYYDVDFHLDNSFEKYDFEQLQSTKKISWFYVQPQRARSNNSVLLVRNETSKEEFKNIIERTKQWGEPGFVFTDQDDTLYNPCFEVSFLPKTKDGICGVQVCNLTSINGALVKDELDFQECVKAQTIIGTLQAGYTDFKYLSQAAKEITDEEALLGNSITGILYNPAILLNEANLKKMAKLAVRVNEEWAQKLGINKAARINLVKPEGSVSYAVGVHRPGIHAAHAPQFFRRTQMTTDDPIYQKFKQHNPHMCETSVWNNNGTDDVVTWPINLEDGGLYKKDISAVEHLKMSKILQKNWIRPSQINNQKPIDHNVSITVIVKNQEWDEVIDFLYNNRADFAAVSFLADTGDKDYRQAPFEAVITEEDRNKFNDLVDKYEPVNFDELTENTDQTSHMAESACVGGACLI